MRSDVEEELVVLLRDMPAEERRTRVERVLVVLAAEDFHRPTEPPAPRSPVLPGTRGQA